MDTIVNKIKKSVQSGTGLTCLYGSLDDINAQMGGQTDFPVAFFVLLNTGNLNTETSNYRERVDVAMFFVKPTEFDFESVENEQIIAECKSYAFQWLNSLYLGGDLRYITTLNTSRVYNQMDDILTGYAVRVRLEELVGMCPPEPFKTTCKVNASANDPTMGTVTGGGEYEIGKPVTLTATKDGDRTTFVSWTVGGTVVSTDQTYTFTATEDVTVVGNFAMNYLRFTALEDNSSVRWSNVQTYTPDIQYSKDGYTWTQYTEEITVNEGEFLMFKGDNWRSTGTGGGGIANYFETTGSFDLSGNIMSLLDSTLESVTIPIGDCFCNLFLHCNIVSAENLILPATTLMYRCYENLFSGCTSLTTAPALPAVVMASECYEGMFQGCTSLTSAPELPATTLAVSCYQNMFENCTALTTAPALPAETMYESCYMFMFRGCRSLVNAPALPAERLAFACYQGMFSACTSLKTAPQLHRYVERRCYQYMFQNCISLNSMSVEFTAWYSVQDVWNQWVNNVPQTGVFRCPRALPIEYGTSRIPTGWTVEYIN